MTCFKIKVSKNLDNELVTWGQVHQLLQEAFMRADPKFPQKTVFLRFWDPRA